MRINKFVALASGMSRRAADAAIEQGRVMVDDDRSPTLGQNVTNRQKVTLDGHTLHTPNQHQTIMLNKPIGYVVSRDGQGSRTIYDLLPPKYHSLKPVGRLDKNSSGLLLLTDDGVLAHELTHPQFAKEKIYEVSLNKTLAQGDAQKIKQGIQLEDGLSKLQLSKPAADDRNWVITMHEGRNRQIRRTFEALGYGVTKLHRIRFGHFELTTQKPGQFFNV